MEKTQDFRRTGPLFGVPAWLWILMLLYAGFQLLSISYGYHRDELYYLVLSRHLDFGYLEMPLLAPLLMFLVRTFLGSSLTAIHLLPALSGAAVIFLTFRMARELEGGRLASMLAAAAAAVAPQYLGSDSLYTYDYLDKLFWVMALYFLLLYLKRNADRFLYLFGLAAGLGLLSKMTIGFLGLAAVAGLAFTRRRKIFARPALYRAGALAFAFLIPYLVWQALHGWPTLEFFRHYASGKTYPFSLLQSVVNQFVTMNPLSGVLWLAGLVFLWRKDKGVYRSFPIMYVLLLLIFWIIQAKYYMIAPFYSLLFAAGAVQIVGKEGAGKRRRAAAVVYAVVLFLSGIVIAPFARPVLPVETFLRLSGGNTGLRQERLELRGLPQHFADRFGWPELAEKCRAAYDSLAPEEKAKAVFLTSNYGEASAIEFFGKKYGLPDALSGHNQYFLWGPRGHTGEVLIAFNVGSREELLGGYLAVEEAGRTGTKYAMPYESGRPIFVCRKPRPPFTSLAQVWPKLRHYD